MMAARIEPRGTSMRATYDKQIVTQFDGEPIAPGYRGRRSMHVSNKLSGRIAIAFAAAVIGCTTAATAVTVKRHSVQTERSIGGGVNLMSGIGTSVGFDAALY